MEMGPIEGSLLLERPGSANLLGTELLPILPSHMGARKTEGGCKEARAHSRCMPRCIGYVSHGAFYDNPPSNAGTKFLRPIFRTSGMHVVAPKLTIEVFT